MATSKIYLARDTAVTFGSNTDTVLWTPKNVANGAGRISNEWDRGAGALPAWYAWQFKTKFQAALALGVECQLWLAFSRNGTLWDGNFTDGDAAWSTGDKRNNLTRLGTVIADSTSSGEVQVASGVIFIPFRYVMAALWNAAGQSLTNTDADHQLAFEPLAWDIQAAA